MVASVESRHARLSQKHWPTDTSSCDDAFFAASASLAGPSPARGGEEEGGAEHCAPIFRT